MSKRTTTSADADPDGKIVVQSDDGSVRIWMRLTRFGLWVQRERRREEQHARLVQSVVFSDTCGFERWCDSDPIRFEYPVVSHAVRREGGALLDDHEHASAAARDRPEQ